MRQRERCEKRKTSNSREKGPWLLCRIQNIFINAMGNCSVGRHSLCRHAGILHVYNIDVTDGSGSAKCYLHLSSDKFFVLSALRTGAQRKREEGGEETIEASSIAN